MEKLKNLRLVILIIGILLILVIVRNSDSTIFRKDVKTAVDAAKDNRNMISAEQVLQLKSKWLVVNIGNDNLPDSLRFEHSISIPFENLLEKANRKILEEVDGDLILYSSDVAMASKAWVILNQLGYPNVFILKRGVGQEDLKYKFQPDTTVRLEQDSI
jgi:hypothetical protein